MSTINLRWITLGLRPRWRICSLTSIISWLAVNVSTYFLLQIKKRSTMKSIFGGSKESKGNTCYPVSYRHHRDSWLSQVWSWKIVWSFVPRQANTVRPGKASHHSIIIASPLSAFQFSKELSWLVDHIHFLELFIEITNAFDASSFEPTKKSFNF